MYFGEELQRLPAHLVDRIPAADQLHGDERHPQRQLVHVRHPRPPPHSSHPKRSLSVGDGLGEGLGGDEVRGPDGTV
jgi:hypothetical protein